MIHSKIILLLKTILLAWSANIQCKEVGWLIENQGTLTVIEADLCSMFMSVYNDRRLKMLPSTKERIHDLARLINKLME